MGYDISSARRVIALAVAAAMTSARDPGKWCNSVVTPEGVFQAIHTVPTGF